MFSLNDSIIKVFVLFLLSFIIIQLIACNKTSAPPSEETNQPIGKIVVFVQDQDLAHTPVPNQEIFINPLNQSKFTDTTGICVFELKPDLYVVEAHLCCAGIRLIDYQDTVQVIENETKYLTYTACLECL